jgi:phosphoglucan,water dikinase
MVHIGNQTSFVVAPTEPFDYALANGFDAFEWFPDKKPGAGWDETDLTPTLRRQIRDAARARGMRSSVHARWQANPLQSDSYPLLWKDLELAHDLGAVLLNIHLSYEQGLPAYVAAIEPLARRTAEAGLQLAIENTPHHSPELFNNLFAALRRLDHFPTTHIGMCLDLGHANLCAATQNRYLDFVDRLDARVPLIHLHLHENWGDADSHLPLFTGPAGRDDAGIRGLVARLRQRNFSGSIILEQWPQPPTLLNQARDRLLELLDQCPDIGARTPRPRVARKPKHADEASALLPRGPLAAGIEVSLSANPSAPKSSSAGLGSSLSPRERAGVRGKEIAGLNETQDYSAASANRAPGQQYVGAAVAQASPPASSPGVPPGVVPRCETDFVAALVAADKRFRSWREKLQAVYGLLVPDSPTPLTDDQLVYIAIYLRFLSSGEIPCEEDGRHFRPGHHARLAQQIQERLAQIASTANAWILRRIYPWLPSSSETFQRPEPLTRIRDIAHRNDIPSDLKREIKTTLQNKLHRCAGPEDLVTAARLLERITAPDASSSAAFVEQFKIFYAELEEFFNAHPLQDRLQALVPKLNATGAELVRAFLTHKTGTGTDEQWSALQSLTELRHRFATEMEEPACLETHELLLADIGLEDFAFVLVSQMLNSPVPRARAEWQPWLELLGLILTNLALSGIDPDEVKAIASELRVWSQDPPFGERDKLLRLKATIERARRLAEDYSDCILASFAERAEKLGRALGIPGHALRVFGEAEIRSHLVFQLSKLASALLRQLRAALALPAWDVVVGGRAAGRVRVADKLDQAGHGFDEPALVILRRAGGDEELPAGVAAVVLAHDMPHLSHLAVRARQAGVVFVACYDAAGFAQLQRFEGQVLALTATPERVTWKAAELLPSQPPAGQQAAARKPSARLPSVQLASQTLCLPLEATTLETAGAKAAGLRRLAELSLMTGAGFNAAPALVVPFGVMELALHAAPEMEAEYARLVDGLGKTTPAQFAAATEHLRHLIEQLEVPNEIGVSVLEKFGPEARLMVRSSANCEDLAEFAGAGLYDSLANVAPAQAGAAVRTVWSSLWTRRAAASRQQAGIPHDQAHMAVLVQLMLVPDASFILHTVNPVNRNPRELYAEIAVGLGETLASGAVRGTPYRLVCDKTSGSVQTLAFANFSHALQPATAGALRRQTVNYSQVALSCNSEARAKLGGRLAAIGQFLEAALHHPQDVEGVVVADKIYLVQTRPQQGLTKIEYVAPASPFRKTH